MKKILPLVIFCLFICTAALGQSSRILSLKDGSQIKGEIINVNDNIFTVKTSFGNVQIEGHEILDILSAESSAVSSASPVFSDKEILKHKQRIINDPEMMRLLQELAQDESILQALSQPGLMNALMSGDLNQIQNDPAFKKILENPLIQRMIQEAEQKIDLR